jgi:hypothetical protein
VWLRRRGFKRAAVVGWSLGRKKRRPEMEARARWPFSIFFFLFFLVLLVISIKIHVASSCYAKKFLSDRVLFSVGLTLTDVQRLETRSLAARLIPRPDRGRQPTHGCGPPSRCAY